jgi:stress response protein YsnF
MKSSLVALFDSQSAAQLAHEQLLAAGFSPESVTMAGGSTATAAAGTNTGVDTEPLHENAVVRFFKNLFGDDHADSNAEGDYREAFRRGSYGLTVNVEDSQIDQAESILNDAGAVDIDERTRQWQSENSAVGLSAASTPGAAAQGMSTPGTAVLSETPQSTSQTTGVGTGGNRTLQEINEELKVGKRVVSRGGIRIYSRMVQTPVEETVRLREEHADVQRRAVDRPATEADLSAFKEGSFEVRETAEEPVVEKTARVVGEVDVGKRVTERDETISDTVRQTRVDVQDLEKAQSSGTAYTPDAPKKI